MCKWTCKLNLIVSLQPSSCWLFLFIWIPILQVQIKLQFQIMLCSQQQQKYWGNIFYRTFTRKTNHKIFVVYEFCCSTAALTVILQMNLEIVMRICYYFYTYICSSSFIHSMFSSANEAWLAWMAIKHEWILGIIPRVIIYHNNCYTSCGCCWWNTLNQRSEVLMHVETIYPNMDSVKRNTKGEYLNLDFLEPVHTYSLLLSFYHQK